MSVGKVFLLPMILHEEGFEALPSALVQWIQQCDAFFVEEEKTTRRFFKKVWKEMVIDHYQWYPIHNMEEEQIDVFKKLLLQGKNIGIIAEAGCAGVADPGQLLVAAAQEMGVSVKPYTGPSSLLLSLMASGFNGNLFQFHGYLPIDATERRKKIQAIEADAIQRNCTQLFIETPYRNNQLLETILSTCKPSTKLCIGVDITGPKESIVTATIKVWKTKIPQLHKRPVIFLIGT